MKSFIFHRNRLLLTITLLLLLSSVLAVSCCSPSYETLNVDGTTRKYLLHIPAVLSCDSPVPLVLALHQFSDTPRGMQLMTGFDVIADREGFIVAYPKGQWRIWHSGANDNDDDLRFLHALIDELETRYCIDNTRIYATGASAGAMMVQRFACHTNRLAAIAPVMGSLSVDFPAAAPAPAPLSVLVIHGIDDPVIPYGGGRRAGPMSPIFCQRRRQPRSGRWQTGANPNQRWPRISQMNTGKCWRTDIHIRVLMTTQFFCMP